MLWTFFSACCAWFDCYGGLPFCVRTGSVYRFCAFFVNTIASAPDLGGGKGPGPRAPTMFMCLAICATCACHLFIFNEKSFFVDAFSYISVGQTVVFDFKNI